MGLHVQEDPTQQSTRGSDQGRESTAGRNVTRFVFCSENRLNTIQVKHFRTIKEAQAYTYAWAIDGEHPEKFTADPALSVVKRH